MPSSQQKKKAYQKNTTKQRRVNVRNADNICCMIFEARSKLTKTFKKLHESVAKQIPRVLGRTMCRLAARRLQACKKHAGFCSGVLHTLRSLQITQREDFGKGVSYTMASEPFFYDSAYPACEERHFHT